MIIGLRPDSGNDFYLNRGILRLWFNDIWGRHTGHWTFGAPIVQTDRLMIISDRFGSCQFAVGGAEGLSIGTYASSVSICSGDWP